MEIRSKGKLLQMRAFLYKTIKQYITRISGFSEQTLDAKPLHLLITVVSLTTPIYLFQNIHKNAMHDPGLVLLL